MDRLSEKVEKVLAHHGIRWDVHFDCYGREIETINAMTPYRIDVRVADHELAGILAEWLVSTHGASFRSHEIQCEPGNLYLTTIYVNDEYITHKDYCTCVMQAANEIGG